ncbi:MAG: hypothetical protein NT002_00915 [candidate division Zixibacteria bacterium]|nr:hypothetical protein [candidate division Zixibacteria bacterium]
MMALFKSSEKGLLNQFISLILVLILAGWWVSTGCEKVPTKPQEEKRNICTPNYLEQAITWDSGLKRWIFHTWKGSGSNGGCKVYINVHDAAAHVPSNFNASAAKAAVINGRDIWRAAIEATGLAWQSITLFESEGDLMTSTKPRIDITYQDQMSYGGTARVSEYNSTAKTFARIDIVIATGAKDINGVYRTMTQDDYMNAMAHEFGHAFGITSWNSQGGHSLNPDDVMYYSNKYSTLSNGDILTIQSLYTGDAYYKPCNMLNYRFWIRDASSYPYGITFNFQNANYNINQSETKVFSLQSSAALYLWECIGTNCRWDQYQVTPGVHYKIIDTPGGKQWDITLARE